MTRWLRMTALGALMPVLMMVSFITMAAAPPELTGMWQGKLAIDAKTSLAIQFTFTKDAKGAYTAVLNSPDNPALKNAPATGVSWDGSTLKLQVPSLQGSYAGTLKAGAITGQWTQPGGNLPLVLAPYQKPVVTKTAAAQLNGAWMGELATTPSTKVMAQFRFKTDDKGVVTGTFSIPDQGLNDSPVTDIEFTDGKLSLRLPQVRNTQYVGTLASGQIAGTLKIQGAGIPPDGLPLSLKRGEYAPPVHALKFTSEQFAAISGKWQGKLELTAPDGQKRSLTMIMRFETNSAGQFVGFVDSPDQGGKGIAITEASLADGKLSAKVETIRGEYTATLSDKTLTGQWKQGPGDLPLVLTRQ
jgi:hypothetical protein